MRKLFIIAALSLAAASLNSCGFLSSMATSIATTPSFTCNGDGSDDCIYDGQSFQLAKLGTCNYSWSVSDPKQLLLSVSGNDATVTGNLTNHAVSASSKITARNADDATIEPVEKTIYIRAWEIKVYDAAGNLVSDPTKLTRSNNYILKMVRIGGTSGNPVYTPVTKLYKNMKISQTESLHSLAFTVSNSTFSKVGQSDLTYTFSTPSKAASCTFTAKLGSVSKKISVSTK